MNGAPGRRGIGGGVGGELPKGVVAAGEDPEDDEEVGCGVGGDGFAEAVAEFCDESEDDSGEDAGDPEAAVESSEGYGADEDGEYAEVREGDAVDVGGLHATSDVAAEGQLFDDGDGEDGGGCAEGDPGDSLPGGELGEMGGEG